MSIPTSLIDISAPLRAPHNINSFMLPKCPMRKTYSIMRFMLRLCKSMCFTGTYTAFYYVSRLQKMNKHQISNKHHVVLLKSQCCLFTPFHWHGRVRSQWISHIWHRPPSQSCYCRCQEAFQSLSVSRSSTCTTREGVQTFMK
jgi:hypothetical protein